MRIVFPEGESDRILQSVNVLLQEKICTPILLGNPERIQAKLAEMGMDYKESVLLIDPDRDSRREHYVEELYRMRARKGVQKAEAQRLLRDPNYFAAMMVKLGDADGVVTGATQNYADAVRPILQVIGVARDYVAAGLNIALVDDRLILMADTTVHFDPDAETLAKMARQSCMVMEYFGQAPRVAMLSYSNFTAKAGTPAKMAEAARLFREMCPQWVVDGDIQSDAALNHELLQRLFPFSDLKEPANVLIFPNLESSNIGYKMLSQLGRGEMLGPFLLGVRRAANVLQRTTTVENIVSSVILTTLTAQVLELGDNKPRV
ncbi:MAG: phosphate acyltransferase [Bdellovibrionaceae bacterium]|nr:phosphate acyltransferase [Pseudobdellovibrionaceae bacterium]